MAEWAAKSSGNQAVVVVCYLVGYVFLDWISYIHPVGKFGIDPWNPQPGFSFAFILLFGRRHLPWLFVAPLLAEFFVRGWPLPVAVEFALAAATATVYGTGLYILTVPRLQFDIGLHSLRDVALLIGIATVTAAVAGTAYVGILVASDLVVWAKGAVAIARFWIGDCIGIVVLTPLLLVIGGGQMTQLLPRLDLPILAVIVVVVSVVFSVPEASQLHLFYLMFLPIIWVAFISGLQRTTLALALTQVCILAGLQGSNEQTATVMDFQLLLYVLSITGLLTSVVVSQARAAEAQLRSQQEAVAKVSRIGSMGALGAAIAHEINQPLTAISTYTDLMQQELGKPAPNMALVSESARKAGAQVNRAAEIIRHLRDLVRLGHNDVSPYPVDAIVDEAIELLEDAAKSSQISLTSRVSADLPAVLVDRIQIEQVIANLVQNAIDALVEANVPRRVLRIVAAKLPSGLVTISIEDNGRGFPPEIRIDDVMSFASSKPDGLGLGLILSRGIVEAHGGRLWIDRAAQGGKICFTLRPAP